MKRFLVISLITLAVSFVAKSQEHSRPVSVPTPRPVAVPTPSTAAVPDGWVNYTSEAGHFNVVLPETPTEKTDTVQSEHGPYTTHLFVVRSLKSLFLVGWVDYDPSFNFNVTGELNMNRENFIKGINATLVDSKDVKLDGYQAIEFTAKTSDRIWKSRVYMVGRRPYQLVSGSLIGDDDSINVDRFFNSFKVRLR
jgi:hypothetical protein